MAIKYECDRCAQQAPANPTRQPPSPPLGWKDETYAVKSGDDRVRKLLCTRCVHALAAFLEPLPQEAAR